MKPCLTCGEPSDQTRCTEHRATPETSARARGYDAAHNRLSKRARRLQPFCLTCGSTEDLQLDHSPETWARKAAGKPLRLSDYRGVFCGPCNRENGSARVGRVPGPAQGKTPVQPRTKLRYENGSHRRSGQ